MANRRQPGEPQVARLNLHDKAMIDPAVDLDAGPGGRSVHKPAETSKRSPVTVMPMDAGLSLNGLSGRQPQV